MSKYTRIPLSLLALAASAVACSKSDSANGALAKDSSLSRDLSLAQTDSAAQPQLQDVPAATPAPTPAPAPAAAPAPAPAPTRSTSAPVRTRPAPRETRPTPRPTAPPPAPAPETPRTTPSGNTVTANAGGSGTAERSSVGTIPAGTTLALTSNSKVCTNTNHVGDRFTASVSDAVTGSNGATIPFGATATVEVTQLDRSENARDKIEMGFRVVSISFGGRTYQIAATTESADIARVRNEGKGKDAQKVATGAAIGAIAGQILGKNTKGTVIGGAIGAAAGAGAAVATANYEGCLNDGARLAVRLTDATQVRLQ